MWRLALPLTVSAALLREQVDNPIKKVVSLLEEMQKNLEQERKNDDDLFKKMECWCKTNRGEKSEAVQQAQTKIEKLTNVINANAGTIGSLSEHIANLQKEVATKQTDLKTAGSLRARERAAAEAEQQEMKETIASLDKALNILGKVQNTGLTQTEQTAFVQLLQNKNIHTRFSGLMQKDLWEVLGSLTSKKEFLQRDYANAPTDPTGLKGNAAGVKSYNNRSGAILGMLGQMNDDFKAQLKDSKASETAGAANYKKLVAARRVEIATAKKSIAENNAGVAEAKIAKSNAETEKKTTLDTLSDDQKFLLSLEEQCSTAVEGYNTRSAERNGEIKAVGEAIGVLTSDESRDQFNRTYSFVQIASRQVVEKQRKKAAVMALMVEARRTGNAHLMAVAVSAQLDAFVKVKAALNKLHDELAAEQKTEFETRDQCMSDLSNNEVAIKDAETLIEDSEDAIAGLEADIEAKADAIKKSQTEIANSQKAIAKSTEERKEENTAFQAEIENQQLTISVLKKAMAKLEHFYGKLALAQQQENSTGLLQEDPAPAPKQATYSKNQAAPGVIGLLQMIIADAEQVIKESTKDETKAQEEYTTMVANINQSIHNANKSITQNQAEKAANSEDKEQQNLTLTQTVDELEALRKQESALHANCDFVVKNFQVRQAAREEEMDSIKNAVSVLSGANFE